MAYDLEKAENAFLQLQNEREQWLNGGYATDIDSGMALPETLGFTDKNYEYDNDFKILKAGANGIKSGVRGLLGSVQMLRDKNIQIHKEQNPEYEVNEIAQSLDTAINSDLLKRYDIKGDTALGQLGLDVVEGGAQLGTQILAAMLTGQVGAAAYMGAQIAGNQYIDLRGKGVSTDRAMTAALINAPVQAVLEKVSLGRLMSKIPAGSSIQQKGIAVLEGILSEGLTEAIQEFPEQFTNIYAENPQFSSISQIGEEWSKNAEQNLKEAAYSGLIGGILGGGVRGANIALYSIDDYIMNKKTEGDIDLLGQQAETAKKSGASPEYIAAAIDAQNPEAVVLVDAQVLHQYAQEKNIVEKLADDLGVPAEDIVQAAAKGYDIEITRGKFIAADKKYGDFFTNLKNDIVCEIGEASINESRLKKELRKDYEAAEDADLELNAELDKIMESATAAGLPKAQQNAVRELLTSRAMIYNPEKPAQFFKENPLEFTATINETANQYFQQPAYRRASNKNITVSDKDINIISNENGKTEITYNVSGDGRSFVMFDDKAIDVIRKYNQVTEGQPDKGNISFDDNKSVITLYKGADASTVFHEIGHYFIETMANAVNSGKASAQMQADWNILLERGEMTNEQWIASDIEGRRAMHERLAEDFETYLLEGKAPSMALRNVFAKIKKWMLKVYEVFKRSDNYREITPEVREVFDRMLASKYEIEALTRVDGYYNKLPNVITDNLSDKAKAKLQNFIANAKEKAMDLLTEKYLHNFTAERKKKIIAYKNKIRPQIKENLWYAPLYAASRDAVEYTEVKYKNARIIARRYLDADNEMYRNWKDELASVQNEINSRLQPIIDELESGMGHGVSLVPNLDPDKPERKLRVSNNAPWYQNWWKEYGKKPTKTQLRQLAYDIYTGERGDVLEGWQNPNEESQAYYDEMKAEIDVLLDQEQELLSYKGDLQQFKYTGLNDTDRITFEVIAETYGFSSGNELAQKIIDEPTFNEAVRQEVAKAVKNKFGDIAADKASAEEAARAKAEEEARETLYNDDSSILLSLEQQLIQEAAAGIKAKDQSDANRLKMAQAMKKQAENAAKNEIAKMNLKDAIATRRFISAERRAAAQAAKALKKKEFELAAEYKRQQALNHALVIESKRINSAVEAGRRFIKRQYKQKKEVWGNTEGAYKHFNQSCALMARMGIVRKDYDPRTKDQTLTQYVAEMNDTLGGADIAPWLFDENVMLNNPYSMTFSQYKDILEALKNIRTLAKVQQGVNKLGADFDYMGMREDLYKDIEDRPDYEKLEPGEKAKLNIKDMLIGSLTNADNLFLFMDNWKEGGKWFKLYTAIKRGWDKEGNAMLEIESQKRAAIKKYYPTLADQRNAAAKKYYKELDASVNKFTLVQMLINLGNDGNDRRLCETTPVGLKNSTLWVKAEDNISAEEAISLTRANLIAFLGKVLNEKDVAYANSVVSIANMYYDEKVSLEVRTKGFPPEKVEATPVTLMTANGDLLLFRGGYYPLVRDRREGSAVAGQNSLPETETNIVGNTILTNGSAMKARNIHAKYPVDISPDAGWYSIRDSIHDLYFRELMREWNRLIRDEELYALMKNKFGEKNMQTLTEMLRITARPYGMTDMYLAEKTLGGAVSWLRRKTTNTAIMLNIKAALQNVTNLFLYGNAIEGFTYTDAFTGFFGNGSRWIASGEVEKRYSEMLAKSTFMRERAKMPDITVRDILEENKMDWLDEKVLKFGSQMLFWTDAITATPVWWQAYSKQINEGKSEQDAIDYADTLMRRTLGSSRPGDVASMQRVRGAWSLFTMFQSFFVTQWNQWAREANIDYRLLQEQNYKEAAMRISSFVAAKYLAVVMISLALAGKNPFADDDDDGYMELWADLVSYPLSIWGPIGNFATYLFKEGLGMKNYGYTMTPIERAATKIGKGTIAGIELIAYPFKEDDRELQELVEPLAAGVSTMAGIPNQLNTWFWNAWDFFSNDMDLQLSDIYSRRPRNER